MSARTRIVAAPLRDYTGGRLAAVRRDTKRKFCAYGPVDCGDHLGSTSITADSGGKVAEQRYKPWGETRYNSPNTTPTSFQYTGQRKDATGLYFYNARYYDPALGRFLAADSIVPSPGNPQSLNRYSYVLNNPLRYSDPSGHCPWLPYVIALVANYLVGRTTYEATTVVLPTEDRARRDMVGGDLVTSVSDYIQAQATDPIIVSAILRHESAAVERRLLTLWPTMNPGMISNAGEAAQTLLKGDTASIGPGQMQVRRAKELEDLGYVTAKDSDLERISALLDTEGSVEYVSGMVNYLSDQLQTIAGFNDLTSEQQQRLILIAYNWGWTQEFQDEI